MAVHDTAIFLRADEDDRIKSGRDESYELN
jgi:hypothetical protein